MADQHDTEDRVTIVETGGGGSGGVLAVVLLVIVVLVLLFLFRDQLGFGGDDTDITIPERSRSTSTDLIVFHETRNDPLASSMKSRGFVRL